MDVQYYIQYKIYHKPLNRDVLTIFSIVSNLSPLVGMFDTVFSTDILSAVVGMSGTMNNMKSTQALVGYSLL